ncbi:hypothetical protein NDU88_002052 [Pleurodeles waltl]|uniref:Uncharacterized protein n=1 Tax=Pleurodeles waltl TaxID=8319 RepID=A0AAV7KUH9_PLEWA|nr:hypothetical protein NDU88_002052 [Pleurodeles waltl]
MDRMNEMLDKHSDSLDMVERRILDMEVDGTTLTSNQSTMGKTLAALQMKVEDLEAHSRQNNLRIVCIAESTSIDNNEKYIELLLIQLLGRQTFLDMFVVESEHRSLAACPPPGAPPRPVTDKLLNYRDRDAALYPDFTQQVQEALRQFIPAKRQLRELQMNYCMLYPAKLRVVVDGKPMLFMDHELLSQFLKRRLSKGRRLDTSTTSP